jgi:hypothetical protein
MPRERVTAAQRRTVFARANGCCEYCYSQARFSTQSFAAEHIIPVFLGGKSVLDNLALACFGCNGHKHTKVSALDSESGLTVPLFHPRQDTWLEHFNWGNDFSLVLGLTPRGRATIAALHLNRVEVVNLRQVLYRVGQHPPYII